MTQMEAARKGILTEEMKAVAAKEYMNEEKLMKLIAEGKVIIPCNKLHKCITPNGVGAALTTKINVNLGTSRDMASLEEELLTEINKMNIGPAGLGGKTSALGLNIETYPTHIAGMPVAVNICCHAARHKEVTI